jgi:CheY-like chemotaxis protein
VKDSFKGLRVLVVEDDDGLRETLKFEFEFFGCHVATARDGAEGLTHFKANKIDLIASDLRMPVCDGIQLLSGVRAISKVEPPFVFLTGYSEYNLWDVLHQGADMMLKKPASPFNLLDAMKHLMEPLEQRWREKPKEEAFTTIELKNAGAGSPGYLMGRSGFFMANALVKEFSKLKVGHIIGFSSAAYSSEGKNIEGLGRVVWKREASIGALPPGCGVEFVYFAEPVRQVVLGYLKAHALQEVIPDGRG